MPAKDFLLALDRQRKNLKVAVRNAYLAVAPLGKRLMVDVGGGQTFNPGWRTLDFAPDVRAYGNNFITYAHDLRSDAPLPFGDGQVDLFYTSHTMEHLAPAHLERVLREMHRSLKAGGGLRVVVPDFDKAKVAFEQGDHDWFDHWQSRSYRRYRNEHHIEEMTGRKRLIYQLAYYVAGMTTTLPDLEERLARCGGLDAFADHLVGMIGTSIPETERSFGYHANWFTAPRLAYLLRHAGFSRVVINAPRESIFSELRPKNHLVRHWLTPVGFDGSYPHISLCADALK